MQGEIVRINRSSGFGFLRDTSGKEYFFHRTALKNIAFVDLVEGQEVTFEDEESTKGPRAADIYV